MANESYEQFAAALQNEYEKDEAIRFGYIESHSFANLQVKQADGTTEYLGQVASEVIFNHFKDKAYIDNSGKVQDILRTAIKNNSLDIPVEYENIMPVIVALVKTVCGSLNIKNNSDKKTIGLNKQVYLDPEFKELWDRIKYKTTYSVDFNSEKLIEECCREMQQSLFVSSAKLIYTKAALDINAGGVDTEESDRYAVTVGLQKENIPDIIAYLQNETNLTRKTIVEILIRSKTISLFKKNPQRYMEHVSQIISSMMRLMIVDGIKYTKIGEDEYYAQELFDDKELTGYLSKNMIESKKSVYEYVVFDSGNEESFATSFEKNKSVKLYAKLPDWFKIATPLGTYNPDWAVLVERDGQNKLYFIVETKGNIMLETMRPIENAKIECGIKHFKALGNDMIFEKTDNFNTFIEKEHV